MKVILQNDVRDLGSCGDIVNVSTGYARNFLFPKQLAAPATDKKVEELKHFQAIADKRKAKVEADKKSLVEKLNGATVSFTMAAGEEDKLFGSVTTSDVADELKKQGFEIDKRDLSIEDAIKVLGQHKATFRLGEGLSADIKVNVEKLT
ncbi:MAG: 50S ribosomal protein L9 [Bdellovibrionales bacterium]